MHSLPKTLPALFWHFIKKHPVAFTVFFLSPTMLVLETNILPYAMKMIIDRIADYQGDRSTIFSQIAPALWLYGGAWIGMTVIFRLQNWWQAYVIPVFQADIRMTVLSYLADHSHHYFSNQFSGSLANKVSDLARALESIRMIICWNIISSTAVTLTSCVLVATISLKFSIIIALWVVVHVTICLYFGRIVNRISAENAEDKSRLSGSIVDVLSNIVSLKIFARKHFDLGYVGEAQAKERESNKRQILIMNLLRLLMDVPVTIMMGILLYMLIRSWQADQVSTGDVVFIMGSATGVMYQMWFLGHELANLFKEIGVARQALTLISVPHDIQDAKDAMPLKVTKGEIRFEKVSFQYQRGSNIFENTSVTIPAGQKVGLVGFSGSGKTTFVHLILRFFDIKSGRILIDGQDIALEASDEEVIEASKRAHCHEFILQIPEAYQVLVGERGIKLSGGQRQRIAIARAMLKNAPILILNEATSALDSVTEKYIQESLLKAKEHYAKMWYMQAGGFLPEKES